MKLKKLFKNVGLEKIQLGPKWASAEISFKLPDRDAAWELYIEMLTRIVTQPLPVEAGDEKTALDSVYSLFPNVPRDSSPARTWSHTIQQGCRTRVEPGGAALYRKVA